MAITRALNDTTLAGAAQTWNVFRDGKMVQETKSVDSLRAEVRNPSTRGGTYFSHKFCLGFRTRSLPRMAVHLGSPILGKQKGVSC
jgi:hypothetical protein